MLLSRLRSHAQASVERCVSRHEMVWVQSAMLSVQQYSAAVPPTSRSTGRSLATTGVPQAIASATGSPNPSRSDGNSTKLARLYTDARTLRSNRGNSSMRSITFNRRAMAVCSLVKDPPTRIRRTSGTRSRSCARIWSNTSILFLGIVVPTCRRSCLRSGPRRSAACRSASGSGFGEQVGCTPLVTMLSRSGSMSL